MARGAAGVVERIAEGKVEALENQQMESAKKSAPSFELPLLRF